LADLLWEKNTVGWLKINGSKVKQTGCQSTQQTWCLLLVRLRDFNSERPEEARSRRRGNQLITWNFSGVFGLGIPNIKFLWLDPPLAVCLIENAWSVAGC
jgi:hypothetical protein